MPYIDKKARLKLDRRGVSGREDDIALLASRIDNCGELNYVISRLAIGFMQAKGVKYQNFNDVVGALDNAKDEFRRRFQHPYEDKKKLENGDIC